MAESEFKSIEDALRRSRPKLPAGLHERVCGEVRAELERRRGVSPWKVAASLAAVALLWLHVSWSAVMNTRWENAAPDTREWVAETARIHDLVPDLPAAEAQRLAFVLHAGGRTPLDRRLESSAPRNSRN